MPKAGAGGGGGEETTSNVPETVAALRKAFPSHCSLKQVTPRKALLGAAQVNWVAGRGLWREASPSGPR